MSVRTTATLVEVTEALVAALAPLRSIDPDLQIEPYWNPNPTSPSIDVFPDDPFWNGDGFDEFDGEASYIVRARVSTADHVAASQLLLRLLDPSSGVLAVLWDDDTLGGVVRQATPALDGSSGFREYPVDPSSGGRLLGCQWKVEVQL